MKRRSGNQRTNQPVCTRLAYLYRIGMIMANRKGDKMAQCNKDIQSPSLIILVRLLQKALLEFLEFYK